MKIHKEGYPSIVIVSLVSFAIIALGYYWSESELVHFLAIAVSAFLIVAILQFFRSPVRTIIRNEDQILCPADGKVVVIEEVEEKEFINERRTQVSIFMSPTNVHINRYPISGVMKYVKYHPGKYLVAWHPKSSLENERTTLVVENDKSEQILFRQIAGAMARRIVYYCKEGDVVEQGEECGFIKFGSRVDLLLPLNYEINVNLGDKVKGGKSIIATRRP